MLTLFMLSPCLSILVSPPSNSALTYLIPLKNTMNIKYSTTLYIGTPPQVLTATLSTFSSVTMAPQEHASQCTSLYAFSPSSSSTYTELLPSFDFTVMFIQYYAGNVSGSLGSDFIFISDQGPKSVNASFLLADQCQYASQPFDAVLGLGLNTFGPDYSIISKLVATGQIGSPIFSLFLDDQGFDGQDIKRLQACLILGGYDLTTYADSSKGLHTHSLIESTNNWLLELTYIKFDKHEYSSGSLALIDMDYSYIGVPSTNYNNMLNIINRYAVCTIENNDLMCDCASVSGIPELIFVFDNIEYSVESKYYVNKVGTVCYIFLNPVEEEFWILGQLFLRRFYSVWDMKELTISFAKVPESGSGPSGSDDISESWVIVIAIVAVLVAVSGGIAIGFMLYKRKKNRDSLGSTGSYISLDGKNWIQ